MNELGQIFNFWNRYVERVSNLNAVAGGNELVATVVPAGEIWIIQAANVINTITAITRSAILAMSPTSSCLICTKQSPAAYEYVIWQGQITLKAGDWMRGYFWGCAAGDDIYLDVWGYKMKVS